MNQEMILILDFGGQYNQLIARRVREHHVYCEIMPWKKSLEEIKAKNPKGIIFTGGPNSVYDDASPKVDPALFSLGVPILGICYGCQLMAYTLGGKVGHAAELSEYGKASALSEKPLPALRLPSNVKQRASMACSSTLR